MLPPLLATRRDLLLLSLLHPSVHSLRLRERRLLHLLLLYSSLESKLLEMLVLLKPLEEGLRALFRLLMCCSWVLWFASLSAGSELLELLDKGVRASSSSG